MATVALLEEAEHTLPIFAMTPGTQVGAPVRLHFFEPRYKILIRRAMEGSRSFVFCGEVPREGGHAVIVILA